MSEEKNIVDLELNDSMWDQLKNYVAFDPSVEFLYVPKIWRKKREDEEYYIPKKLWPKFRLKSKDGVEIAEIDDSSHVSFDSKNSDNIHLHSNMGKKRIQTLKSGILGVDDYPMEKGQTISFKGPDGATPSMIIIKDKSGNVIDTRKGTKNGAGIENFIRYLPVDLQIELQDAINERSVLSEEEKRGLE
jgi:hypothetical protein